MLISFSIFLAAVWGGALFSTLRTYRFDYIFIDPPGGFLTWVLTFYSLSILVIKFGLCLQKYKSKVSFLRPLQGKGHNGYFLLLVSYQTQSVTSLILIGGQESKRQI